MDVFQQLFKGDVVAALWALAFAVVTGLLGEAARRVLKARSLGFVLLLTAFVAIIGAGGLAFSSSISNTAAAFWGRIEHSIFAGRGDPIIVGVYPSDAFGPLHRDGLHAGLAPYANQLRVVDLEASYADMKADNAPQLLVQLRNLLTRENVVAVIGPPVTEFTRSVVKEVERSGLPVPIFVTSATSRAAAGWDEARVPLFRINSGVDERALEFVDLARAAVRENVPLVFLVETGLNSEERTYGQILFEAIARQIPEWKDWVDAGRVTRKPYERGSIVTEVARLDPDTYLSRRQLIMLLGVGRDYRAFVESYYKADSVPRQTVVGGWMNAYDAEPAYRQAAFQWQRMFELTDSEVDPSQSDDAARRRFENEFGASSPAKRDQAFSFDAGAFVAETLREAVGDASATAELHVTEKFLRSFAQALKDHHAHGVTGDIRFGASGQNQGAADDALLLSYVQFLGPDAGWRRLGGPQDIVALLAPATPVESPAGSPPTVESLPH
jgi:hypothetical protein